MKRYIHKKVNAACSVKASSEDGMMVCENCADYLRSRGEVHTIGYDIPEDRLREPTEEEIEEYGFSDYDMVGVCEWCEDLCTEDDLRMV